MRFMVIVKATEASEAGEMPSEEMFAAMAKYNEELAEAGVLVAADGLKPSSEGARVRFGMNGERTVIDGPFLETKELIAGYWIFDVGSREEAIDWVRRCPNPHPRQESEVEIRQIFELEDYEPSAALAKHGRLRERLKKAGADG